MGVRPASMRKATTVTDTDTATAADATGDQPAIITRPAASYDALALNAVLDSFLTDAAQENLPQPTYVTLLPRAGMSAISMAFRDIAAVHAWGAFHHQTCVLSTDSRRVFHEVVIRHADYTVTCYHASAEH